MSLIGSSRFPFPVYVFVGEHIATVDFVRCLQNKNLLQTGEYVVISVDDEIYDPSQRLNFMDRSKLTNNMCE